MTDVLILAFCILLMLVGERLGVVLLTRSERGRLWVRNHALLHPNTISLVRIPMGLVSVLAWMQGWQRPALLWFAFWMITDLTDGTLARHCQLTTEKGKWLDPLSDKAMYFPVLLYFAVTGPLPLFWVSILLVIDAAGQASRLVIRKKAANYFGKVKTALITTLLAVVALAGISDLPFISMHLMQLLTISTALLAFLSAYCKVIPDSWYANTLTLANFLCGLGAIYSILHLERPLLGFLLVFAGQFFDLFDGRLARKYGSTRFGAIYDDLADGTSFGAAIAILIFYQLRSECQILGVLLGIVYFACVTFRLYRFAKPTMTLPPGIFQGMPGPAGAMLAGSAALLFGASCALTSLFTLLASVLMVSNLRYRHFGQKIWPELPNALKLVLFILLLIFLNMSLANRNYAWAANVLFFALGCAYTALGMERIPLHREPDSSDKPSRRSETS